MTRSLLHRYWLSFGDEVACGQLAVGVTAFSLDDALAVLKNETGVESLPELLETKEDFAVSELDPDHVIPNMHPLTERGVWFPKLSAYH